MDEQAFDKEVVFSLERRIRQLEVAIKGRTGLQQTLPSFSSPIAASLGSSETSGNSSAADVSRGAIDQVSRIRHEYSKFKQSDAMIIEFLQKCKFLQILLLIYLPK